jgi:hypothetical protein
MELRPLSPIKRQSKRHDESWLKGCISHENPIVTHAAEKNTEPDHRPNLPLFAPARFC